MWKHKESKWLVRGGRKVRCYLCGKKILKKDPCMFHENTGYYSHNVCIMEANTIDRNERRRAVKKIAVGAAVVGAMAAGAGKFIDISSQSKGSNSPDTQTIITSEGLILPSLTSDPANPVAGQMWYRSDAGVTAHFDSIQNRVVYSSEINNGMVNVTSKGIINGLSVLPNDGTGGFGPDTTLGATAPGQYGSPYTEAYGIQESIDYGIPKGLIPHLLPGRYIITGFSDDPDNTIHSAIFFSNKLITEATINGLTISKNGNIVLMAGLIGEKPSGATAYESTYTPSIDPTTVVLDFSQLDISTYYNTTRSYDIMGRCIGFDPYALPNNASSNTSSSNGASFFAVFKNLSVIVPEYGNNATTGIGAQFVTPENVNDSWSYPMSLMNGIDAYSANGLIAENITVTNIGAIYASGAGGLDNPGGVACGLVCPSADSTGMSYINKITIWGMQYGIFPTVQMSAGQLYFQYVGFPYYLPGSGGGHGTFLGENVTAQAASWVINNIASQSIYSNPGNAQAYSPIVDEYNVRSRTTSGESPTSMPAMINVLNTENTFDIVADDTGTPVIINILNWSGNPPNLYYNSSLVTNTNLNPGKAQLFIKHMMSPDASPNSTAGTTAGTVLQQPLEYSPYHKKIIFYFNAYENDSTTNQSIDFQWTTNNFTIPFTSQATITYNNTGLTITASTTGITITAPDSTTTYSGIVIVEGY